MISPDYAPAHECCEPRVTHMMMPENKISDYNNLHLARLVNGETESFSVTREQHIKANSSPYEAPYRPDRLPNRSTLRRKHAHLSKPGDDLFHVVLLPGHSAVLHQTIKSYFREDHFSGGRPQAGAAAAHAVGVFVLLT
jgi:hypothetical protein